MRDQLRLLEELQKHDAKLQELTDLLDSIPRKLQATENDLARIEGLLSAERAQLEDTRRYLNDQRSLLELETNQVQQAKHKLSQAKNPREANAAQREIEQTRELAQSRENEIRKLLEAIESKEKILAERTREVELLRDAIARDSETAKERMAALEEQVTKLTRERDQLAADVPKPILSRYAVIRKRKGNAVVPVRGGTCMGCNMNIPPQLYNNLRRGNTIETCPYCQRILYAEDDSKPAGPASAAPPEAADENGSRTTSTGAEPG